MALRVLTVDDSKTIRMIVKKAFKDYDCELFEAENGQMGLEVAAREKPNLIILDITMPVMTGVEMLEKLKADPALKAIPVIMLTAESGKDNVMNIVKMGVSNYMVKPFKGEQLIERAKGVVALEAKPEKPEADPADKYFRVEEDIHILSCPDKITRPVSVEIETFIKKRIKDMSAAGQNKLILDLSAVKETNMSLIKVIVQVIDACRLGKVHIRVVGSPTLRDELKDFAETSEIPIHQTVDEVKTKF